MGLGFGVIFGWLIIILAAYIAIRSLLLKNYKLSGLFFGVLGLFLMVGFVSNTHSNWALTDSIGFAPLILFFLPTTIGLPLWLSIVITTTLVALPFVGLYYLKKPEKTSSGSVLNPTRVVHLFEIIIGGTSILILLVVVFYFWSTSQNSQDSNETTTESSPVNREEEGSETSLPCSHTTLYGFPYYLAPNENIACYRTNELTNADPTSLIPLEAVMPNVTQELVPTYKAGDKYDLAFDVYNFYINGNAEYSVSDKSFELITKPRPDQEGSIRVNGTQYRVLMSGLVGATLR